MKKYLPLLFIVAAFVYSCTKTGNTQTALTGKWFISTDSVYEYGSIETTNSYSQQYYYQFNADGTGQALLALNPGVLNFTYTLGTNVIYIKFPVFMGVDGYFNPQTDTAVIRKLSPGTLSIGFNEFGLTPEGRIPYHDDIVFTRPAPLF